jgi:hypothetical protein
MPFEPGELLGEGVEDAEAAQPTAGHRQRGVEFVQVPAQPALNASALAHEVPAVVDQQLHLPGRAVELGDRNPSWRNAANATASASIVSDFPG